jgi:hypothetical protein
MATRPQHKRPSPKQSIAQQLNWLKAEIINQYWKDRSIQYQLDTLGIQRPTWLYDAAETNRTVKLKGDLKRLQDAATKHGIKGNYTEVLPYEQTRFGKRIAKSVNIPDVRPNSTSSLPSDTSLTEAQLVDLSMSEKRGT